MEDGSAHKRAGTAHERAHASRHGGVRSLLTYILDRAACSRPTSPRPDRPRGINRCCAHRCDQGRWKAPEAAARRRSGRDTSRQVCGWRSDAGNRAAVARYGRLGAAGRSHGTSVRVSRDRDQFAALRARFGRLSSGLGQPRRLTRKPNAYPEIGKRSSATLLMLA